MTRAANSAASSASPWYFALPNLPEIRMCSTGLGLHHSCMGHKEGPTSLSSLIRADCVPRYAVYEPVAAFSFELCRCWPTCVCWSSNARQWTHTTMCAWRLLVPPNVGFEHALSNTCLTLLSNNMSNNHGPSALPLASDSMGQDISAPSLLHAALSIGMILSYFQLACGFCESQCPCSELGDQIRLICVNVSNAAQQQILF